jgi:hypothetical protein
MFYFANGSFVDCPMVAPGAMDEQCRLLMTGSNCAQVDVCANETMPGGDADEHGCIASAGYTWCESKAKCLRIWEEDCPGQALEEQARGYCGHDETASAEVCGEYVKVVSSLLGGGSTFHANGTSTSCPVVGPDAQTPECTALLALNCTQNLCE